MDNGSTMKELLDLREAAPLIGKSRDRLYVWIHSGAIPAQIVVRLGDRIFLRRAALLKWLRGGELEEVSGKK
jgi:excisionase family DNA binding protein